MLDEQLKKYYEILRCSKEDISQSLKRLMNELDDETINKLIEHMPEDLASLLQDDETYKANQKTVFQSNLNLSKTVFIEKTKTEIKEIVKTEIVQNSVMRRKLFTVIGNGELCAEMAYVNAKFTDESILVIDLDTFTPEIHRIYGMKDLVNNGITIKNMYTNSSFLQAYEIASTKQLNYDILRSLAVKHKFNNLHILTGNDIIQKGEGFNVEPLKEILEVALSTYSIVYVNIPFDPYKALNLYMILNPKSTLLIPFNGGAIDLVNKKRMMKFIKESNHLEMRNIRFVAFEYNSSLHLDERELKHLTDGQYIGSVQFDSSRVKSRNDLQGSHLNNMSRKTEDDYRKILTRLGISIKVKLREKFERLLRKNK